MTTTIHPDLTAAVARLLVRTETALDRKAIMAESHRSIIALEQRATTCASMADHLHESLFG